MPWRYKRIYSGKMLEHEIYPISQMEKKKSRREKKKESALKQKNLNEKNCKKKIVRLINTNFTTKDIAVTLSYNKENLPDSLETCKKDVSNFLRRIKRYLKKHKLPDLKYIAVIENKNKGQAIRIHHHLIVSGDIARDQLESMWKKGRCNTYRLQENDFGFEGIARYIVKEPLGNKRYSASRNLKKPKVEINDSKYNRRKVYALAMSQGGLELENEYKDYKIVEFKSYVNEELGAIYINAKMKRRE
ncbi:rolling circle replication-associated protein [Clostridium sp. B9]|uniref:rolling circle replication-associated protein n=1 Tax=Clostridium sp. B9 TaxID=3423224 RepID=UPI003D2EE935